MKIVNKLAGVRKEKGQDFFEATRFVQERIDLYFKENTANIIRIDSEHNQTARILSGHLITYSTVVIGLVSLVLSQEKLLNILDDYQKSFLFAGLVLLFMSLLAGALELWDATQHFKKIALLYAKANKEAPVSKIESITELHEFKNSLFKDSPEASKSRGLFFQISLLSTGSILFLIVFATIIFR